jgi:hypothetical protein
MLRGWRGAVKTLAHHRKFTMNSPLATLDEDEWPAPNTAGNVVVVAPPMPAAVAARLQALETVGGSSSSGSSVSSFEGDGGNGSVSEGEAPPDESPQPLQQEGTRR